MVLQSEHRAATDNGCVGFHGAKCSARYPVKRRKFDAVLREILKEGTWQDQQKVEKIALEQWRKKWGNRPTLKGDELIALINQALGKPAPQISKEEAMDTKLHELKSVPERFIGLMEEERGYDVRQNDRNYKVGDTILFKEFQENHNLFTGRGKTATITSITPLTSTPGVFGALNLKDEDAFVILGLRYEAAIDPIRDMVREFSDFMYVRFLLNAGKGPADKVELSRLQLIEQLRKNVIELEVATYDLEIGKTDYQTVFRKAVDAGNFCLLIGRWGRLKAVEVEKGGE